MHDLDRTYLEDSESLPFADAESEGYGEHNEHGEHGEHGEHESGELADEGGGEILHEDEVAALAAELLGVTNEHELDHFLTDFLKSAAKAVGGALGGGRGGALGGVLKGIAKVALPALVNSYVPGMGGVVAGALGLELEGLSPEDQELEAAKQYIRLGAEAVRQAVGAPDTGDPGAVVEAAVTRAAQQFAPGLLRGEPSDAAMVRAERHSGRWVRRGRDIVILDGAV